MKRLNNAHPSDGDLLRYADGELGGRETKKVQAHLASCWKCRTELDEIQKTIGECVRYRETVLQAGLPEPPQPWFDIDSRMGAVDEAGEGPSWLDRLRAGFRFAVQPMRVSVGVAMVLIALLIVDQFRNAPSVQAAELLSKAAVAAESRPDVPQRIEVRTAGTRLTRVIGNENAKAGTRTPAETEALAGLEPLFEQAHYSWADPLSARSFAAWRETLADKRDEVVAVEDQAAPEHNHYRIRTTTSSSSLTEATLQLTWQDLRPVQGTWRFGDRPVIEMTELGPALPAEAPPQTVASAKPPPAPAANHDRSREIVRPATPGEELHVFAVLRRLGADLGEPVDVTRKDGKVLVTGVGVSPAIEEELQDELAGMPHVALHLSEPATTPLPSRRPVAQGVRRQPGIEQLQSEIEKQLGGRLVYEEFVDQTLTVSDEMMAHLHALRRLAERFPSPIESELSAEDHDTLLALRREHAVAAAGLVATLEEGCRPALRPIAEAATPTTPLLQSAGTWQTATDELFDEARGVEELLAGMLGGVATDRPPKELPEQTLAGLARLRARAAGYVRNTLE